MKHHNPSKNTEKVEIGGPDDLNIRSKHEVLYVAYETLSTEGEGTYSVTYCEEIPSKSTCDECFFRYSCKFSEAPKLRG